MGKNRGSYLAAWLGTAGFLSAVAAVGLAIREFRSWRASLEKERQFNASYPRNSGALSAVTGGDPEDINAMPTTLDPWNEGPIYDGSDLGRSHAE